MSLLTPSIDLRISADCHLMEPPDLFSSRLPKNYQDTAVKVEFDDNFIHYYVGDRQVFSLSKYVGRDGNPLPEVSTIEERQRDFAQDGYWGEVIHPNLGMFCYLFDNEVAMAHVRVYNDYVAEFFGPHLGRHKPSALIPLTDVADSVAEIERVAALGIRVIAVPTTAPERYCTKLYDPVWAAAQASGMVVVFHNGSGVKLLDLGAVDANPMISSPTDAEDFVHPNRLRMESQGSLPAQYVIADLIGGGILERFPDLHFVAVEFNAFWLAGLMAGMDKAYTVGLGQDVSAPFASTGAFDPTRSPEDQPTMVKLFGLNDKWPYPLRPSDYVRRQVHVTFQDDPAALAMRGYTGVDSLVWGSDYPHHEGSWPRSPECLDTLFADISDDERRAILGGTMAKILDFDVPAAG